jgi:hypothetical protein
MRVARSHPDGEREHHAGARIPARAIDDLAAVQEGIERKADPDVLGARSAVR